jgi:WD40 repeat protein
VIVSAADHTVRIWDARSGELTRTENHESPASTAAIGQTADGRSVIVSVG